MASRNFKWAFIDPGCLRWMRDGHDGCYKTNNFPIRRFAMTRSTPVNSQSSGSSYFPINQLELYLTDIRKVQCPMNSPVALDQKAQRCCVSLLSRAELLFFL